jgi:hypothetical protein
MAMYIYDRQKDLGLDIPKSVAVIGVGGVGSWVALDLALVGVKKLILVDHDIVEDTNLNRTPFCIKHIGQPKVVALSQLIIERRRDCQVIPIQKKYEDLNDVEKTFIEECQHVIDCRDTIDPPIRSPIVCGYDGFSITIHINPDYSKVWGDEPVRYTVTPSFVVPPQFLATLITLYLCCPEVRKEDKEVVVSTDIREVFNKILEL